MSDTPVMNPLRLMPLWRPRSTLSTPSAFRPEVRPPSLRHAPASLGQRLLFWLLAPAPQDAAPPINRLPGVQQDFLAALSDVPGDKALVLRAAVERSRSLRELWHLRAEVYNTLGLAHSEQVAEQRLQRLNRHFPTRAPRSASGPAERSPVASPADTQAPWIG